MLRPVRKLGKRLLLKNWAGYCPICEAHVRFFVHGKWYRDELLCGRCYSLPRERALMRVVQSLYPNWRELKIHESSPGDRGASRKIAHEGEHVVQSQYIPEEPAGSLTPSGQIVQSLEQQTFLDEQFDIVITQDVFEHLFHPDLAIREIVRTLKPGGAHIMSVPIVRKAEPSRPRAVLEDGNTRHLMEPEYHGNPVGDGKSLVTFDWGYDIADYLTQASFATTTIHTTHDRSQGIEAEYLEIVVTRKPLHPPIAATR